MLQIKKKTDHENAQGLVEFALILPVLLLVVLGIIEFGRLLFFYSSITSASREAARFGAAVGEVGGVERFADCAGIRNAARRAGTFANIEDGDIVIQYDDGAAIIETDCPPVGTIDLADRIVVTVSKGFQPIVPLVNIPPIPITSTTARTIIKEVGIKGTPVPTDIPPGVDTPTPSNTPTDTPTETPTDTPTETATGTATNTPTATSTGTLEPSDTPTITLTPTSTFTPTPSPTPACPSPGGITSESKKIKFKVTNPDPSKTYLLSQINLLWPATGPDLKSITFAGYTDNISPSAPPASYSVSPNVNVTFVDQEEMTFTFQNNLSSGQTFQITIRFEGCADVTGSYTYP